MIASFSAFGGYFPSIALIVLRSLEGSVLWSSVSMFFSDVPLLVWCSRRSSVAGRVRWDLKI